MKTLNHIVFFDKKESLYSFAAINTVFLFKASTNLTMTSIKLIFMALGSIDGRARFANLALLTADQRMFSALI